MSHNFQCVLGIQTEQFVMIAADQTTFQAIYVMNTDEDKIHELSDKVMLGVTGDGGDVSQVVQFVMKSIDLYKIRNGYEMEPAAVAHFIRKTITDAFKHGALYEINLLLGGYSETDGGQLYYMDCFGCSQSVPFAAHGFGSPLCYGILEQHYDPLLARCRFKICITKEVAADRQAKTAFMQLVDCTTLSEVRVYEILEKCVMEIQRRLLSNLPKFMVKVVNKDGVKKMPIIHLKISDK